MTTLLVLISIILLLAYALYQYGRTKETLRVEEELNDYVRDNLKKKREAKVHVKNMSDSDLDDSI